MIGIGMAVRPPRQLSLLQQALSAIRRNNGTALYVPDDYRGAFVDSTGTQPVTAINDLVGLLTDRVGDVIVPAVGDFGVTVGFDNVLSGVSAAGFTSTGGTTASRVYVNVPTVVGRTYLLRGRLPTISSGTVIPYARDAFNGGGSVIATGASVAAGSVFSLEFRATTTSSCFLFAHASAATFTAADLSIITGNHGTQGTTASKPLVTQLANGTKALDFDGSNDLLTLSSGAILQQGSDHFVSAAFVLDAVGTVQAFYGASSTASNTPLVAMLSVNTSPATLTCLWRDDAGILVQPTATEALVAGVPYVATASKVGNTYSLWLNGVLVQSATATLGTTTLNTANIGMLVRLGQSHQLNGKLIDIVIDQGTLTAADRKTIERNMAQRAGVAYVG